MWVDMVLKPYVDTAPEDVVPILFLDSYHCHMMNLVVNAIQDLGVQVEHIPGGYTSLCQPVDIGINKPFKAFLCKAWEKWMIDEGIRSGTTSPPTRELIAKWASYAKDQIKEMHIRNAWRHEPFSWFPTSESDDAFKKGSLYIRHSVSYSLYVCCFLFHIQEISCGSVMLNWCLKVNPHL